MFSSFTDDDFLASGSGVSTSDLDKELNSAIFEEEKHSSKVIFPHLHSNYWQKIIDTLINIKIKDFVSLQVIFFWIFNFFKKDRFINYSWRNFRFESSWMVFRKFG